MKNPRERQKLFFYSLIFFMNTLEARRLQPFNYKVEDSQ